MSILGRAGAAGKKLWPDSSPFAKTGDARTPAPSRPLYRSARLKSEVVEQCHRYID